MNILHLSTPKTWRGGEQQVYWLFEEIQLQTNNNQLLVCPQKSAMQQKCIANNWNHEAFLNMHHFNPIAIRQLAKICRTNKINIVHLHDAHALNMGILAVVLFNLETPLVFTRRVDFKLNDKWFTRFKYNHLALKKVICVSNKIKEVIKPDIKNTNRLKTIYSGIDTERFSKVNYSDTILRNKLNISKETILISNISALSDHKDLLTFVEVANKVLQQTNKEIHFVLIGEGIERTKIEQRILELKLQNKIILTGFRNDIANILPEIDIFLMTSKEEGLGTTVLDAMAAGVPVVSTNAGGLPESVLHNETGLVADVKNVTELSNHVIALINNPILRTKLAQQAKENVKINFSKQKMAKEVLAVYNQILA